MKKFIILYKGPATPPDASHAGWQEWFKNIGDALVDIGSPMTDGQSVNNGGEVSSSSVSLNGYGIIQADDMAQATSLLKDHPYTSLGDDYTVEIFEIPKGE